MQCTCKVQRKNFSNGGSGLKSTQRSRLRQAQDFASEKCSTRVPRKTQCDWLERGAHVWQQLQEAVGHGRGDCVALGLLFLPGCLRLTVQQTLGIHEAHCGLTQTLSQQESAVLDGRLVKKRDDDDNSMQEHKRVDTYTTRFPPHISKGLHNQRKARHLAEPDIPDPPGRRCNRRCPTILTECPASRLSGTSLACTPVEAASEANVRCSTRAC